LSQEGSSKENSVNISDRCTYETFQLCLLNAGRLIEDSDKVSPPTQAALLELAFEECGKALLVLPWMVVNKLKRETGKILGDSTSKINVKIPDAKDLAKDLGLQDFQPAEGIDNPLQFLEIFSERKLNDAFYHHKIKLGILASFLCFVKKSVIPMIKIETVKELMDNQKFMDIIQSFFPITDLSVLKDAICRNEDLLQEVIGEVREQFNYIDVTKVKEFDKLKEDGFYVDYIASIDSFVFPRGLPNFENEKLRKTIISVIQILRFSADFLVRSITLETTQGNQK